jgi:WD40 repeat protein
VAFSPDGKTLASIDSYSTIMLWDPNTLKPLLSQPFVNTDPGMLSEVTVQTGLTFSPDSTMLAVAGYQSATLWNVAKHERVVHAFHTRIPGFLSDSLPPVSGVAFSPDGQQLLFASVSLDPYYGQYRDSRGLARALGEIRKELSTTSRPLCNGQPMST